MLIGRVRNDPDGREETTRRKPQQALQHALDLLLIAGSAHAYMQRPANTDARIKYLDDYFQTRLAAWMPIDLMYR